MKLFNVSNFYCDCNEIDIDIAAINQIGGTANAAIDNNLWNFVAITINKIRKTGRGKRKAKNNWPGGQWARVTLISKLNHEEIETEIERERGTKEFSVCASSASRKAFLARPANRPRHAHR